MAVCCGLVIFAAVACGTARAGTAVPDGDQLATYVTNKFSTTLSGLRGEFTGTEPRKSSLSKFIRVDDFSSDGTITGVQVGQPPSRVSKNQGSRTAAQYLVSFHPAGSSVEFLQLGPAYASLAPTPWVALPYNQDDPDECNWAGQQDACEILQSVGDSLSQGHAAKNATSKLDGSVELTADVSLRTLLDDKLLVFEPDLMARIDETMKNQVIPARITLDSQGKLSQIDLIGTVVGNGHEVEVKMNYRIDGEPSANDLPQLPDPSQVTTLTDSSAVDTFYQGLHQINSGG